MYAIVDIETTGGYANNNDITEIAIILHNGSTVTDRFETLIRPSVPIPYFIQVLTGIGHDLVAKAPPFSEVAEKIYTLLQGRVFIAHNVNFDYSFLKHHLAIAGFDLQCQKLCTVRLARKVFPDLPSYSLGKLCRNFGIQVEQRHRAGRDADATVRLFNLMLDRDGKTFIEQFLKRGSKEQCLPPNLPRTQIDALPYCPGVYYFHDQKDQVIYVGKAKNIKYRVSGHFTHNGAGRQRQEFLRNIYKITHKPCSTELMASILESVEIKRLWPRYNTSQKIIQSAYAIYRYEDRNGYIRLVIDKQRKGPEAVFHFHLLTEGHRLLNRLTVEFSLCPKLNFIQTDNSSCTGIESAYCRGACGNAEDPQLYNQRVEEAITKLQAHLPSFAIIDSGNNAGESSCILVDKGKFYGMGYIPAHLQPDRPEVVKDFIQPYPENEFIRGMIYQYVQKSPAKKIDFFSC